MALHKYYLLLLSSFDSLLLSVERLCCGKRPNREHLAYHSSGLERTALAAWVYLLRPCLGSRDAFRARLLGMQGPSAARLRCPMRLQLAHLHCPL